MITKLDSFLWHQFQLYVLNMRWIFKQKSGKNVVYCILGMISSGGSKLKETFRFLLSFLLASKCLAITLALTNVDFKLDATWSVLSPLTLELACGGNHLSKPSRGVGCRISASSAMHLRICLEIEKKSKSTKCLRILDSRLGSTNGTTYTSP